MGHGVEEGWGGEKREEQTVEKTEIVSDWKGEEYERSVTFRRELQMKCWTPDSSAASARFFPC